jgi:3-phenylpropionate/trans-cinnamate dioxygenase ferredoxin reductase component
MDAGMVIVGAGEAGARAASSLREQGYSGPLTLIGEETYGPYERPPLSKAVMTAGDEVTAPPFILDEAKLSAQSIAHISNVRAEVIDRDRHRVLFNDGRGLTYAKLLIATGAGARRLPTPGATNANVHYVRSFSDALRLRSKLRPGSQLVVIGGGFIGLELAASAVARGCAVTLVEVAPRILMRGVPVEVAECVANRHRTAGVELRTGVGIERIGLHGDRESVVLADGTVLAYDVLVAGIGAVPETQLAEASGLVVENEPLRVDRRLFRLSHAAMAGSSSMA